MSIFECVTSILPNIRTAVLLTLLDPDSAVNLHV
jgi:hypothetical protein